MWAVYFEDLSLFYHSIFFVVVNEGKIVGSVKVTRWNNRVTLPVQHLFNVNLSRLIAEKNGKTVWHIGRLAIAKEKNEGAQLLRKLITLAIYPICMEHSSMMVAECDSKVANVINRMGIQTDTLGPAIHYLGSPTVPIYSTGEWLLDFLKKSPHLGEVIEIYERIASAGVCLY
jgi:hypothetical protein